MIYTATTRMFFFILLIASKVTLGQIQIDWPICVEERVYNYTNAKLEDYILKHKFIKFCYSHQYFGLNDNGYLQVFPLEAYSSQTDKDGNITESFINGACQNYNRGDLYIVITHSKPQTILINYTVIAPWSIYIETNSLYTGKVTVNKNPPKSKIEELAHFKIDSFINYSEHWGNGNDTGVIGECKLNFLLHKNGTITNVRCIQSSKNSSIINRKYFNSIVFDKKLNEVFLRMPTIKTDFKKGVDSKYFDYKFELKAYN